MSQPTRIKVLSCNIRVDVPDDALSGNGWIHRKDLCAEVILAQGADLICVQECQIAHFEDLRKALIGFESFGLLNPAVGNGPTNAIFYKSSRFGMLSAGGFWLSETPHVAGSVSWDSARPRFVNWVHLKDSASDREFRMWNLHFDHIGQTARENQARVLVEGSQVFGDDFPQLLTGDFNADASNPAIDVVRAGGWVDTYTEMHGPNEPGHSYHGFIGPEYPASKAPKKIVGKMDFVFHKGPIETLSASIVRDGRDGRYPSDHYFVSAEVALQ